MMVSILYLLIAYLLAVFSYSKNETPPFVPIFVIYGVSLLFPFALATFSKNTLADQSNLLNATRGTSLGMLIGGILAILLLFAGSWTVLLQTNPSVIFGLPIIFFGSALLPYFASARSIALKIINPEGRPSLLTRLSAPHNSFVILSLWVMTRTLPTRKVLVRTVDWTLVWLIFPLAIGWLLLARTVGPASLIFPILFYGLMFVWTDRNIRQIGREGIETLRDSIRAARDAPGPSTISDMLFTIFVATIFIYLIIEVIVSPFY